MSSFFGDISDIEKDLSSVAFLRRVETSIFMRDKEEEEEDFDLDAEWEE